MREHDDWVPIPTAGNRSRSRWKINREPLRLSPSDGPGRDRSAGLPEYLNPSVRAKRAGHDRTLARWGAIAQAVLACVGGPPVATGPSREMVAKAAGFYDTDQEVGRALGVGVKWLAERCRRWEIERPSARRRRQDQEAGRPGSWAGYEDYR